MRRTIKSKEVYGLLRGYIEPLINRINVDKAYSISKLNAAIAQALTKKELDILIRETEEAIAWQESQYALKDGWYEKSKPTRNRPYKIPEIDAGTIEHLFLDVLITADPLFVYYFETERDHETLDMVVNHGDEDDPIEQHYSDFIRDERLRWATRIRVTFNNVEKDECAPLIFK